MNNPLDLSGRKILISGASSGIGQGIARYLSELGATLILLGRNEEGLKETVSSLEGSGHRIIQADLAAMEDMSGLFSDITQNGKEPLNGLVHSAGIMPLIPLKLLNRSKIKECMDINYYSFIELVRQYARKKNSSGGSIVAVSSIAAKDPDKCQTIYAASKAAINMSVSTLALELVSKNIRINSIMPGTVATKNTLEWLNGNEALQHSVDRQLLGMADIQDIAYVCGFLLSNLSKTITGRAIYADCGRIL